MNYLDKLFNLEDKFAVIIGSGGHICSEISKGLNMAGCNLLLLDIRNNKNIILKKNIKKFSNNDKEILNFISSNFSITGIFESFEKKKKKN